MFYRRGGRGKETKYVQEDINSSKSNAAIFGENDAIVHGLLINLSICFRLYILRKKKGLFRCEDSTNSVGSLIVYRVSSFLAR